jgi:hypothetical protein
VVAASSCRQPLSVQKRSRVNDTFPDPSRVGRSDFPRNRFFVFGGLVVHIQGEDERHTTSNPTCIAFVASRTQQVESTDTAHCTVSVGQLILLCMVFKTPLTPRLLYRWRYNNLQHGRWLLPLPPTRRHSKPTSPNRSPLPNQHTWCRLLLTMGKRSRWEPPPTTRCLISNPLLNR